MIGIPGKVSGNRLTPVFTPRTRSRPRGERDYELEGTQLVGEARYFDVHESVGFGGCHHILLLDLVSTLSPEHPDGSILPDGRSERLQSVELSGPLYEMEDHFGLLARLSSDRVVRSAAELSQKLCITRSEHRHSHRGLHAEFVEPAPLRIPTPRSDADQLWCSGVTASPKCLPSASR